MKRYIVQPHEGFTGMEFLSESPVGRRIYQSGEEVELDDSRPDVKQSAKEGRLQEVKLSVAPKSEIEIKEG